jgi:hypothetical protein
MKHLLSSTAFLVVNKKLAALIGLKETILLADLISKEEYFIQNDTIQNGWFFNTSANIKADTTLTPFQQRKCITSLKKHSIIDTKLKGIPAKQYFKINEDQVIKLLNNLKSTKCKTINKNKIIKTINKYFKKPTISELDIYCTGRNNNIDTETFYNFYESKGWKVGNTKMKDWKAAIITWEKREKKQPQTMSKIDNQLSQYEQAKKLLI